MVVLGNVQFDDADRSSPDIVSAFHNSSGYNYLLTQLMVKVAQSSINHDILGYYEGVYELYGWVNQHFTEPKRKELEKVFGEVRIHINAMHKAVFNKSQFRERAEYSSAKRKLDDLKHFIVRVMSEQNLLSPMSKKNVPMGTS